MEFGFYFKLTRHVTIKRNTITCTYYKTNYNGYKKLTTEDKKEIQEQLKNAGFTIK